MSNDILSSFKEVNKRVYGKNFFLFFDELYSVDAINSIQASNNDLHKAFFDLNKEIKSRVFKREIALKDSQKMNIHWYVMIILYVKMINLLVIYS